MIRIVLFLAVALLLCGPGRAQSAPNGGESALTLSEVLTTSAAQYPKILEALAQRRAAGGAALAAQGAFDTVFSADGFSRVTGFWDGSVVRGEARRNLRTLGASVYGGYKLSDGNFPIYEDVNFTNTGGELKVGVLFSLLRDRSIDDRRFGALSSALDAAAADFDVLLTRIGVQHQAQIAYWRWVAAGRQLEVYENLLAIAQARQNGLEEQVRQGARARIFLTENRQNITRRQILKTEAERDFVTAANTLSLYYRGPDGAPVVPARNRLPNDLPMAEGVEAGATSLPAGLLARRPELNKLEIAFEQADALVRLGRNDLKPKLDFNSELSRDFGAIAEGGISRDSTDLIVGFRFSVPLANREARGKLRKAEADRAALEQRRRLAQDQIAVEVRNILLDLDMSRQLAVLAEQEVDQSETMARAERRRFDSGASDFFLVNIREETAADARVRGARALLNARIARANYDAATVNLQRLGLGGAGL